MMRMHRTSLHAFTLVELSIVLVILGLLVGGVLAGQSLIRAAELRAVGKEYNDYIIANNAFREKYMAIPGDMSNATAFWGKNTTQCNGDSGSAGSPGTCNGNGDGIIPSWNDNEQFRYWQQLSLAGLIEGQYTGITGSGSANDAVIGVNVPKSRLGSGGWNIGNLGGYYAGDAFVYAYDYGTYYNFGSQFTGNSTINPIVSPAEAWNIDTKFDDGRPGRGRIFSQNRDDCTDSANPTDYDSDYLLNVDTTICSLAFLKIFGS